MSRYSKSIKVENSEDIFKPLLQERELKSIFHYRLNKNFSIPDSFFQTLSFRKLRWDSTMRMYKLADSFYGDPNEWWVIALINKKPTDFHWTNGDEVLIPIDLGRVKDYINFSQNRG
jgi:hypothetical protein